MADRPRDVIVIGSGFGGSPAAARLAEAGMRVTLLERGPWRDTLPTRSMGIEQREPFPRGRRLWTGLFRNIGGSRPFGWNMRLSSTGLFELFFGQGVTVAASSNVGGGSHVYSAAHARPPDPGYWNGHAEGLSAAEIEPRYEAMLARFGSVVPTAEHGLPNTTAERFAGHNILEAAIAYPGARLGYLLPADPAHPRIIEDANGLRRSEVDYRAGDDGFLGSPSGGKTTLDVAYLWPAMRGGNLVVRDMSEVVMIRSLDHSPGQRGGPRYEVSWRDLRRGGRSEALRADHVIVAAGTINTLKLLMASRHAGGLSGMPRLGQGFGTNGDLVAFWDRAATEELTAGLPTLGGFRLRGGEDGPVLGGGPFPGVHGYPLPGALRRRLARSQTVFGMGADASDGVARYDGGRFRLRFDTAGSPIFAQNWALADRISELTGKRILYRRNATTVHPIGGAGPGRDETTGVIDANGEVFGHPGLFVTDGAALPGSPGSPPSLSIGAWSEHVAARLLARPN